MSQVTNAHHIEIFARIPSEPTVYNIACKMWQ